MVDVIVVFISFCGMLAMARTVYVAVGLEFDLDVDVDLKHGSYVQLAMDVQLRLDVGRDADDDYVERLHLSIRVLNAHWDGDRDVRVEFCMCKWWFWNRADRLVAISAVFLLYCN